MDLARAYNIKVLEDAAEGWGMESFVDGRWKKAGAVGDIGIYSFFPTKTLGAYGDAGLMVTDDEALYRKIKMCHVHGTTTKYHHEYIGYNSQLDTLVSSNLASQACHHRTGYCCKGAPCTALYRAVVQFPACKSKACAAMLIQSIMSTTSSCRSAMRLQITSKKMA